MATAGITSLLVELIDVAAGKAVTDVRAKNPAAGVI